MLKNKNEIKLIFLIGLQVYISLKYLGNWHGGEVRYLMFYLYQIVDKEVK